MPEISESRFAEKTACGGPSTVVGHQGGNLSRRLTLAHPFLLAIAPIVHLYLRNMNEADFDMCWFFVVVRC